MPEWLGTQQVSELIGVPVSTLYYWRLRNEGPPAARVGKRLKYRKADVERWLDERLPQQEAVRRGA